MSEKTYFQNVETYDEGDDQHQPNMGTLSKQFQPKKLKDGNKLWNKVAEQDNDNGEEQQSYSYTPFRAATLGKSSMTPKPTRDTVHSGTLRPPKSNPFVYDPPSAPTTPRMPRARPESAAAGNTMSREQKLTWGRVPAAPEHFRSNSAMSRARPNEFSAMGMNQPPILAHHPPQPQPQRYPSFNTLPRGEPIDAHHHHHQMMMAAAAGAPFYGPPMSSRPPSAVPSLGVSNLAAMAPMVTPMMVPPPPPAKASPRTVTTQLAIETAHLNWNRISIICCLQVLFCLSIFGVGVARIMFGAMWAIGVEIVFATCAIFPALVGIYAVRKGSYSAAIFCFTANAFEMVFATVPFVIGLFPVFPIIFPKVEKSWFLSPEEPLHLDLILSFLIAVQVFLALTLSLMGCRAGGSVMTSLDELKLQQNMRKAFDETGDDDIPPFKSF